jgi:hypothetical protein
MAGRYVKQGCHTGPPGWVSIPGLLKGLQIRALLKETTCLGMGKGGKAQIQNNFPQISFHGTSKRSDFSSIFFLNCRLRITIYFRGNPCWERGCCRLGRCHEMAKKFRKDVELELENVFHLLMSEAKSTRWFDESISLQRLIGTYSTRSFPLIGGGNISSTADWSRSWTMLTNLPGNFLRTWRNKQNLKGFFEC